MRIRGISPRSLLLALVAPLALSGLFSSTAAATQPIEGIWSFGGGAVAVTGAEAGILQGTVVQPTTLAVCPHPVGQVMWTEMKERPNGSYWGRHQWYRGSNCALDPRPGLAAWRVMQTATGSVVLIACLSDPGERKQPKIAPDGKVADATYGCVESAPLASVPGSEGAVAFEDLIRLPPAAAGTGSCRRSLTILPRKLEYDPLKRLIVKFDGLKVADVKGVKRLRRRLVFDRLPAGSFEVRVIAITVLAQRRALSRSYRGCSREVRFPGRGRPDHG